MYWDLLSLLNLGKTLFNFNDPSADFFSISFILFVVKIGDLATLQVHEIQVEIVAPNSNCHLLYPAIHQCSAITQI